MRQASTLARASLVRIGNSAAGLAAYLENIVAIDDICVWADGTWCYGSELSGMTHMSDDYEVVAFDSPRWHAIVQED